MEKNRKNRKKSEKNWKKTGKKVKKSTSQKLAKKSFFVIFTFFFNSSKLKQRTINIPQLQTFLQTETDFRDPSRYFPGHKVLPSSRTFMIKQNAIRTKHFVPVSVILHGSVSKILGNPVRRHRQHWGVLILRCGRFTELLTRTGLVHSASCFESVLSDSF